MPEDDIMIMKRLFVMWIGKTNEIKKPVWKKAKQQKYSTMSLLLHKTRLYHIKAETILYIYLGIGLNSFIASLTIAINR